MTLSLNQSFFLWLNLHCAMLPDWFWASLTITGHTSMVFALLSPLALWRRIAHGRVITALIICGALGGVASKLLKESFLVLRPPAVLTADQFHLIGHKLELVSFPSGHTLTAFAVATLLILGMPWRGWRAATVFALACLIGLSRVAVGVHWPLDVLVGALVGSSCAYLAWRLEDMLYARYSQMRSAAYKLAQAGIISAISASLLITPMGYPQAIAWQWLCSVLGVAISLFAILLHLKSIKIH